jgi:RNA polymerase sigma-70 factor (ECF subfamily)
MQGRLEYGNPPEDFFLGRGERWRMGGPDLALIYGTQGFLRMSHLNRELPVPETEGSSDGSLVRRFRAGEQDAATALYRRYAQRLQRLAQRNTASDLAPRFDPEDVVQSVFRTFFRRVQKGYYDLPAGEELWRLLLVISLNKIRALAVHHRAQKRNVKTTVVPDPQLLSRLAHSDADELALHSLQMVVREVLNDLPYVQQQMILRRIDGCQVDEIASETGRSKRTVERVLQTFRLRLRKSIDEPANDDEHSND